MAKKRVRSNPDGFTDLIGQKNVSKSDETLRVIGALDEASAALGLAKAFTSKPAQKAILEQAQQGLSLVMAFLAGVSQQSEAAAAIDRIERALNNLEEEISRLELTVEKPHGFIFPGENPSSAALDFARATTRRAERELVGFSQTVLRLPAPVLEYLNRLSSLCYLLELANLSQSADKSGD